MSEAFLTALTAFIDFRIAVHSAAVPPVEAPTLPPVEAPAPAPADIFGLGMTAGAVAAAPVVEVTPQMIQQLIIPHLPNEGAKAGFQAAMKAMGISELPSARPDQLPELYARFKAVADEATGSAQPATAGPTII